MPLSERTSRPMSPIPNRAIISYPTPIVTDRLIIEYVSIETGTYENLPYGTLWSNTKHTAFAQDYPTFQLVFKAPAIDSNNWWERRVWVDPRADANSYNYSLTYAEGDPDFPTVTRVDVVKRDEYQPDAPLTEDPDYPGAFLTDEKMVNETNPPEANSLYVTVVKTYETLPGPIVLTQDGDQELNVMVNTSRQVVLSTDLFQLEYNPLVLAVTESPRTKYTKLRIISYLSQLPPDKPGYETGRFPFPTLVSDIVVTQLTIAPSPDPFSATSPADPLTRQEVAVFPITRASPNVPALFRTNTTFAISEPVPAQIYVLNVKDLVYRGISFSIAISNVLNDAITCSTSFTDDGRYGNLSESVSFGASTPSASQYQALVDAQTYVVCGADITRWRFQIFVTVVTEVLLI